jgi:hypothetical protein
MTAADRLAAGRVAATLLPDGARLRDVSVDGEVVLRGIGFVVRDPHWATHALAGQAELTRSAGGVALLTRGTLDAPDGDLDWQLRGRIDPDGIDVAVTFRSRRGFLTNRTGLVALHALAACRGRPARAIHTDGTSTAAAFPELVAPHCPFLDLAGLEHVTAGGLDVAFRFTGEAFETEDQRNWTDASFKTYSRRNAQPHPYRLEPGVAHEQRITVRFGGSPAARAAAPAMPLLQPSARLPRLAATPEGAAGPFATSNRADPPGAAWVWSSSPTVHADDDDTIGETIEPLPDLIATARARVPDCRISITPIRLNERLAADPRRGGLIEAAWVLGSIAGFLDPAVEVLGFEPPVGATAHLLARLHPGQTAQSVGWPGVARARALLLPDGAGRALAVAHTGADEVVLALPPGDWTGLERLGPDGFRPAPAEGARLTLRGAGVAWLRAAR